LCGTAGRVPPIAADLPHGEGTYGAALANAIHAYDRQLGYPYAWYFMMQGQKAGNYAVAAAVLADPMGAYEYLPARDLRVLRVWGGTAARGVAGQGATMWCSTARITGTKLVQKLLSDAAEPGRCILKAQRFYIRCRSAIASQSGKTPVTR
jgi:hypothetical protein